MCGIVGYIGKRDAAPILIEGLHRLEYRGYDSAGIAVVQSGELKVSKCRGRVRELEQRLPERFKGAPGIACLLYTSPSPRDGLLSRMPSSA